MPNYLLQIILKKPQDRTIGESATITTWKCSVILNNENYKRELDYYLKLDNLFNPL